MSSKQEILKKKILDAQKEGDIASLYVLENDAYENFDEEMLHGYYANILDLALEKLTDTLEAHRVMDMNDVQDFATLRALYEYAMEHYSVGKASDAAALFEVLSGLTKDKGFSKAMQMHQGAASTGVSLDEFLENIADLNATEDAKTWYISHFVKEAQDLLNKIEKKESK
jgi:hypothetical protein